MADDDVLEDDIDAEELGDDEEELDDDEDEDDDDDDARIHSASIVKHFFDDCSSIVK